MTSEQRIERAILLTIMQQEIPISEFLNQPQFLKLDRQDLIASRKLKLGITKPRKSRCTEKCKTFSS